MTQNKVIGIISFQLGWERYLNKLFKHEFELTEFHFQRISLILTHSRIRSNNWSNMFEHFNKKIESLWTVTNKATLVLNLFNELLNDWICRKKFVIFRLNSGIFSNFHMNESFRNLIGWIFRELKMIKNDTNMTVQL